MYAPKITPTGPSLLPSWMGRALVAASLVSVADGVITSGPHAGPQRAIALLGLAAFAGGFALAYRRPGWEILALSGAGGVAMAFVSSGNGPFIAVVATVALAAARLPREQSRPLTALIVAGYLIGVGHIDGFSAERLVAPFAGLLFTQIAMEATRRLREEQRRTQSLLQEVIAGRDARIEAAALAERARLAREMHDILAHTLSALSIQLEGARMRAAQRPDDPAILPTIERAGRLARQGLEEARRAVGSLRGDSLPGPDLLPALADDFESDTGIETHMRVEGAPRDLPPDGRLALYRVAQEALTNVRKHAEAACVVIVLRYTDKGVELVVENDGAERPSPVPSGGFGLSGMRERAELLGGRLETGSTGSGYRVCLWIPA